MVIGNDANVQQPAQIVNALCFNNDRNLLLVLKKREDKCVWIFPGGKVHAEETLLKALEREMKEALPNGIFLPMSTNHIYKVFQGKSPFSEKVIEVIVIEVFLESLSQGSKELYTGAEIDLCVWITPSEVAEIITCNNDDPTFLEYPVSDVTLKILDDFLRASKTGVCFCNA